MNLKRKLNGLIKIFFAFVLLLFFSVALRLFAFEIYAIPTPSMEGSILVGDKVLVNKMKHGPALPQSPFEIPWFNLLFYFNDAYAGQEDSVFWEKKRLYGYGEVERGDVVVFGHPEWDQVFIKRCVGLPGDTLEIRKGKVFINDILVEDPLLSELPYQVQVNDVKLFRQILREDNLWGRWTQTNLVELTLTKQKAEEYASYRIVDFVEPIITEYTPGHELYPGISFKHHSKWSVDKYGPYIIPYKGMKIEINPITDNHYWPLINFREDNDRGISVCGDTWCMADSLATTYEFKKDYYFMMGDNRHDSADSRYWGPVQEDKIIGVVNTILFSNGNDGFRWNRFFKSVEK